MESLIRKNSQRGIELLENNPTKFRINTKYRTIYRKIDYENEDPANIAVLSQMEELDHRQIKVQPSLIPMKRTDQLQSRKTRQAWDPEAEIREQNSQNEKERICNLAKESPTHLKYWEYMNTPWKAYVSGNKVAIYTGLCYQHPLGKEYYSGDCKNLYKIIGGDLVNYVKCPGKNTLKHIYEKV